jgi:hypothetical protein
MGVSMRVWLTALVLIAAGLTMTACSKCDIPTWGGGGVCQERQPG